MNSQKIKECELMAIGIHEELSKKDYKPIEILLITRKIEKILRENKTFDKRAKKLDSLITKFTNN